MDLNGVLSSCFNRETNELNVTDIGAAISRPDRHTLDANGVMAAVFDPETRTIRVVTV